MPSRGRPQATVSFRRQIVRSMKALDTRNERAIRHEGGHKTLPYMYVLR